MGFLLLSGSRRYTLSSAAAFPTSFVSDFKVSGPNNTNATTNEIAISARFVVERKNIWSIQEENRVRWRKLPLS